jgi:hypothetical protein
LHHRRLEVIYGVTDVGRQKLIQATNKLFLFGVDKHVIQGDPVIVLFFLVIYDVTVGEQYAVTTGTFGLGVVVDDYSIEAQWYIEIE